LVNLPGLGSEPVPSLGDASALPRQFADYELLKEIARGGMGVVFKARQISLDRIVAVKLLLGGALASPELVKRFRLEAAAAGGLQHPNIVAIHEVGFHEGQHFIVMDYVEGPNLTTVVAGQPLPPHRAAGYLKSVAEAIEYAHSKGILHRDLKPSNILLDTNDQPRVTDFGLAKKLESDVDLTVTGQVLGSPNYMPPEQAAGQRTNLNRAADVYSLGAILYHLVTGRPPFQAATLPTTLEQVRTADPVTPRRLNASLPRDLETICLKCLEKEPSRRYPTAQALVDELDRFLKSEPIRARRIGTLAKTWRWCRRKPALATVGASAALLLLTLAIGGPIVAARERNLAESNRQLASQQLAAAEGYRRSLYASDLNVAYQAWQRADLQQAVDALDRHIPKIVRNDWREFTWRYLNRLCQPYREPPLKAPPVVLSLATTKDGRLLAASGARDFVTVWDLKAQTRLPLKKFRARDLFVWPLCFSPDGHLLVTGGMNDQRSTNGLQVWDTTTWQRVTCFTNLPAKQCDFSPDGKLLAAPVHTRTRDEVVLLEVGGSWKELRRLTNHTATVWTARFSRDGKRLVTGSADRTARVWDTNNWNTISIFTNTDDVIAAIFSPDGDKVATAGGRTVRLWDVNSGDLLDACTNKGSVVGLDFSPEGRLIASGGRDGLVKLWDWRSKKPPRELRGHTRMVSQVRFVLGGTKLASASRDGMIRLWDLQEKPPNDVLAGPAVQAQGKIRPPISFFQDGSMVATVSSNAMQILLWDTLSGVSAGSLDIPPDNGGFRCADLAFSPRAEILTTARVYPRPQPVPDRPPIIRFWNVRHRIITNSLPGQAPMCFSQDGRWFACQATNRGTIQFLDLRNGRTWTSRGGFQPSPDRNKFAFSPDGHLLASSGFETVLWETKTGNRVVTIVSAGREEPIDSVAFTPDSRWLIGAGSSGEIQIWDVITGERNGRFHAHLAGITSLTISPDGKTLASGSGAGLIKLWRLEPPDERFNTSWAIRELLTLTEHQAGIVSLRFSPPKGDILGSSDADGVVRLWRADPAP